MAKITLTIEAEGPSDLHEALADLCDRLEGGTALDRVVAAHYDGDVRGEEPLSPALLRLVGVDGDTEQPEMADPPEGQGQGHGPVEGEQSSGGKRRRRTKAELEADPEWRAKNGLPPLPAQDAPPSRTTSKPLFGIGAGATAAEPAAGPQAQQLPEGPVATENAEAAFKAAFRACMAARGAKTTQEILLKATGARMTAEVKPEQYAAATAAFREGL